MKGAYLYLCRFIEKHCAYAIAASISRFPRFSFFPCLSFFLFPSVPFPLLNIYMHMVAHARKNLYRAKRFKKSPRCFDAASFCDRWLLNKCFLLVKQRKHDESTARNFIFVDCAGTLIEIAINVSMAINVPRRVRREYRRAKWNGAVRYATISRNIDLSFLQVTSPPPRRRERAFAPGFRLYGILMIRSYGNRSASLCQAVSITFSVVFHEDIAPSTRSLSAYIFAVETLWKISSKQKYNRNEWKDSPDIFAQYAWDKNETKDQR